MTTTAYQRRPRYTIFSVGSFGGEDEADDGLSNSSVDDEDEQLLEMTILVESKDGSSTGKTNRSRVWFVDWMRSIAIYLVVSVHTIISILRIVEVDDALHEKINATLRVLLQFGMPIFFYFSGRAAQFSSNDGFLVFVYKKIMRLLVPLFFGVVLIVAPTSYIGRSYRPCANKDIDSFSPYIYDFFVNQLKCSGFEWLWFLPVLFILAVVNFPLFTWMNRRYSNAQVSLSNFVVNLLWFIGGTLASFSIFVWLGGLFLKPSLPWIWIIASVSPYVLNTIVMIMLPSIRACNALFVVFLMQMMSSLAMAYLLHDVISVNGKFASFCFYNLFFVQGFVDQLFDEEYREFKKHKVHKLLRPFATFVLVLVQAIGTAGTSISVGYLYDYPIYWNRFNRLCYVLGTWMYLILFVHWGQAHLNESISPTLYKHATQSTIVVYLIHWLFIDSIQVYITRPLGSSFAAAFMIEFPLTILLSWLFYVALLYIPFIGLLFGFSGQAKKDQPKNQCPLLPVIRDVSE